MIHEDRADRRAEKLGRAEGGVGVEKDFCAVAEDLSVLSFHLIDHVFNHTVGIQE